MSVEHAPSPVLIVRSELPASAESAALQQCEETLVSLLGRVDYEYAKDSGLVDMFYFNPETGRDGLLHVLSGDMQKGPNGAVVVEGFHHEPSAEVM